ncbi:G-protein coupled receptor 12-like [Actinia tenebrosa]|uniref:G-protein coupled receptor 12-like n=1 Tax=Actinia tenebrosa TaxID=6105 RepID=A0A6P8H4C9_ACTTE|nr:G-protein coupled receptor 12-like [Actinia tenebrosa]
MQSSLLTTVDSVSFHLYMTIELSTAKFLYSVNASNISRKSMSNISSPVINFTCPLFETHLFYRSPSHEEKSFLLAMIVLNAVMAAVTSCSNAVVIYTISRTPSLQTPSNILILGLAISDFCVGMFVQPSYCVFRYAEYRRHIDMFCTCSQVYLYSCVMLIGISIATLTSITGDRFLAVHLHLRYRELVTIKRYGILLAIIWAFGVTLTIVTLFKFGKGLIAVYILIFVVLFLMNVYFIWKVFRVIRRHSAQIQVQQQSALHSIKRRKKSVYTMYSMIAAFLMCYIPYLGASIGNILNKRMTQATRNVIIVTETLIMFNCVLNPIIYCWRIEDMRDAVFNLLKKSSRRDKKNLSEPQKTT